MNKFLESIILFSLVVSMNGMERDTRFDESNEKCLCATMVILSGAVVLNHVRGQLGVPPHLDLVETDCFFMEPADPHLRAYCWGSLGAIFIGLWGLSKDPNHSCCASRLDLCQRWLITRSGKPNSIKME